MKEEWGNPPNAAVDGMCAPALGDAIWKFQSFWKANGTFKNIDGVVDPNGNTLRVLNTLVLGAEVKAAGPNSLPPANTTNLNKMIEALRGAFPRALALDPDERTGVRCRLSRSALALSHRRAA